MSLIDKHRIELERESGIDPEVVAERGYRTIEKSSHLRGLGFAVSQCGQAALPALLLPICNVHGEIASYQIKPEMPRIDHRRKTPRPLKYETPAGTTLHLDVPPRVRALLDDPTVPLYVTEGSKKADAGASRGLCIIALLGVAGWWGRNNKQGYAALGDWSAIALKGRSGGREVRIVFDSDVMRKREVHREMEKLAGYLESRGATVFFIYLPDGPGGKKQGLDDYLVAGAGVWDLNCLAERKLRPLPRSDEDEDPVRGDFRSNYVLTHGGLKFLKQGNDGTTTVPITTFGAVIRSRITRDDGEEQTYFYDVEARENGHIWRGQLSLDEWSQMEWAARFLAPESGLVPGSPSNARHADFGFRQLSAPMEEITIYAHLGWRKINDQWLYLHNSGAIGLDGVVEGVQVDSQGLSRYCLPEPPNWNEENGRAVVRAAVRRSLGFLDIASRKQTWLLLAAVYTAPLATIFPTDFTVWVRGVSGSRKSTVAALALCHFGEFDRYTLPANFTSTPNAIEMLAFAAKDALLVIDDYAPAPEARTQQQQEQVAHRLLRGVGDQRGRQRLDKEAKLRADKGPRCLPLVTSELPVPGAQSSEARSIEVVWERDAVDLPRLQHAMDEDATFYRVAMAAYLRWLAPRMTAFQKEGAEDLRREIARLRGEIKSDHGRLPETGAKLSIGVRMFLRFAQELDALHPEEAEFLWREAKEAISACADRTSANQMERKPAAIFLTALRALLDTGSGYLSEKTAGGKPETNPAHWGWQLISGDGRSPRPLATNLGHVVPNARSGGQVWLDPEITFQAVKQWTERSGIPFPGNKRSLGEALANEGLLTHTTDHRPKNTAQVHVEGKYRDVWSLAVETVWPGAELGEELIGPDQSTDR